MRDKVERVGDQQNCFVLEVLVDCHRKEESSHMSVNSTQDIIQNVDVSICVKSSCKGNSGLLTSRECGSSLSDDLEISIGKKMKISLKRSIFNCLCVSFGVVLFSKKNVVSDSIVHDPCNLTCIGNSTISFHLRISLSSHFSKDAVGKRGLSTSICSNQSDKLTPSDGEVKVLEMDFVLI